MSTLLGRPAVDHGNAAPEALALLAVPRHGVYVRLVKPTIDRTAALLLLLLLLPLIALVAAAVRVDLGPGVLFKQERVGQGGRPFHVYKFRTMKHSRRRTQVSIPHLDRRVTHKHPDDPRLTPVGAFLRKWSLDELPQVLNILRGEMSFVGPRPELPFIVERYEAWQHRRHTVRPGLAGAWQNSMRGLKPMHECVEVDVRYAQTVSALTDLLILIKTPRAAFGRNKGF